MGDPNGVESCARFDPTPLELLQLSRYTREAPRTLHNPSLTDPAPSGLRMRPVVQRSTQFRYPNGAKSVSEGLARITGFTVVFAGRRDVPCPNGAQSVSEGLAHARGPTLVYAA